MKENWEILQNRIPLEEAVERISEALKPLVETECDLEAADGTILSESYQAQYDQPPFPRSPLDGYALRGEETKGASREHPVVFPVVDKLCAGDRSNICVNPGQAVRIMTGAMIPEGANAVIRQEDTDLGEKQVSIWEEVKPYGNYCFQGEDYHAGDILVKEGTRLDYISIGILASGGKKRIGKDIENRKRIFRNGLLYTLGRVLSYTLLGVVLDDTQQNELALGGRVFVEGCAMRGSDITYSGKVGFDVLSNEYKMTDYQFSRPYISPQLDKQLDERQRTALLSPEGLDCSKEKDHPILGKNGKALTCILRIDPRSNGVVYDFSQQRRQEQQEKQEQKAEKAQEQAPDQGQGRGRKR